jgi:chemotaxis response regulator CheB
VAYYRCELSAGGVKALSTLLASLPHDLPIEAIGPAINAIVHGLPVADVASAV